jgi:DNA-binding MarR family transcriptional regulator
LASREIFPALMAMARGLDRVHSSGLLAERSGVNLERGLHPVLATIGDRGPLRTTELAAALALKPSTISRHVARLEALGLVDRIPDLADARASTITLSEQGMATFQAVRSALDTIISERLSEAGLARPEAFVSDLERVGAALESLRPRALAGRVMPR